MYYYHFAISCLTQDLICDRYMLEGKDGYDCFKHKEYIVDPDNGQLLSLMLRNYFRKLEIAAAVRHAVRTPQEVARDKFKEIVMKKNGKVRHVAVIAPKKDGRILNVAEAELGDGSGVH